MSKEEIYLEALNQISDICIDKENHGAKLTGINPIQKIIQKAHGDVLDLQDDDYPRPDEDGAF